VDRGNVTLTGNVDSWQEKQLAADVVEGVDGVVNVNNRINVNTKVNRPDTEIATDIRRTLHWDVLVDDALVNVDVNKGKVNLSGVVGSNAEKRRTMTDAWVSGVYEVNADNLKVESWARDDRFRSTKYVEKDDSEVRQAIEDALTYDPRVSMFNVNVGVNDGVVTLSGIVDNIKAKRAADRDAENTMGVWWVKNLLKVRMEQPVNDETLGTNVREALIMDPYVEEPDITVNVKDGVVKLTGQVDTYFQKAQAEDVVSRVNGVILVKNNLDVNEDQYLLTYNPYVDYYWWDFHDLDWYNIPNDYFLTASDGEIKDDIEDELWWSPFINSEDVHVDVNNGVAHLTGIVDSWSERKMATEKALEGGAVAVNNDILVDYGPQFYQP
jgi:osmotically-inducible protein OsmY